MRFGHLQAESILTRTQLVHFYLPTRTFVTYQFVLYGLWPTGTFHMYYDQLLPFLLSSATYYDQVVPILLVFILFSYY